jgi:hypothetical protein
MAIDKAYYRACDFWARRWMNDYYYPKRQFRKWDVLISATIYFLLLSAEDFQAQLKAAGVKQSALVYVSVFQLWVMYAEYVHRGSLKRWRNALEASE